MKKNNNMKFRNYCIVVMGNMEGVKDDIIKIAETKPRYIDAKGILIATFASIGEPAELEDFFNLNGRSFFLFDTDKSNSGYNLDNPKLQNHLFGHLMEEGVMKEMSEKIMEDISATTSDNVARVVKPKAKTTKTETKVDYSEMTIKEREVLVNKILDKGYDKLNDSDRDILKKNSCTKQQKS